MSCLSSEGWIAGTALAEYNPRFAKYRTWAELSSPFFLLERFILLHDLASRR
jgi:hypothetical protein